MQFKILILILSDNIFSVQYKKEYYSIELSKILQQIFYKNEIIQFILYFMQLY